MPGPQPQKGPLSVTRGHFTQPWATRRHGARAKATGPEQELVHEKSTSYSGMQRVYNKMTAPVERLHEKTLRQHACKAHN